MEQRRELMYDRHTLPSRYWEPDEEDLRRMEEEVEITENLELPFE